VVTAFGVSTKLLYGRWVTVFIRQTTEVSPASHSNSTLDAVEYWPKCGDDLRRGMKAGWLIPYVDKRVDWQIKLLDLLLTRRATLVALETSIAHYEAPCKMSCLLYFHLEPNAGQSPWDVCAGARLPVQVLM